MRIAVKVFLRRIAYLNLKEFISLRNAQLKISDALAADLYEAHQNGIAYTWGQILTCPKE
jgi:hypothetical protein